MPPISPPLRAHIAEGTWAPMAVGPWTPPPLWSPPLSPPPPPLPSCVPRASGLPTVLSPGDEAAVYRKVESRVSSSLQGHPVRCQTQGQTPHTTLPSTAGTPGLRHLPAAAPLLSVTRCLADLIRGYARGPHCGLGVGEVREFLRCSHPRACRPLNESGLAFVLTLGPCLSPGLFIGLFPLELGSVRVWCLSRLCRLGVMNGPGLGKGAHGTRIPHPEPQRKCNIDVSHLLPEFHQVTYD